MRLHPTRRHIYIYMRVPAKKRVFHGISGARVPVKAALRPKARTQIDMVLSDELTSAVAEEWHVVEAVHTWLQNLYVLHWHTCLR